MVSIAYDNVLKMVTIISRASNIGGISNGTDFGDWVFWVGNPWGNTCYVRKAFSVENVLRKSLGKIHS